MLGPPLDGNDLLAHLYTNDGQTLLGTSPVVADQARFDVSTYRGPVILQLLNRGNAPDYLDEASGQPLDMTDRLLSVAVLGDSNATVNLNPITSLAARLLLDEQGLPQQPVTPQSIHTAVETVAQAFNLSAEDVMSTSPDATNDGSGTDNALGRALAALSGLDAQHGGRPGKTIDTLVRVLQQTDRVAAHAALEAQLMAGAMRAESANPGLLSRLGADQRPSAEGYTIEALAATAGGMAYGPANGPLPLSGTVPAGTEAQALSVVFRDASGSRTAEGTVNVQGSRWSYAPQPGDWAQLEPGLLWVELWAQGQRKASEPVHLTQLRRAPTAPSNGGTASVPNTAWRGET